MQRYPVGGALGALAICLAAPGQAQTSIDLPQITITDPGGSGSLTVPGVGEARRAIWSAPGAVSLIPAESFRNGTPASTVKDVLEFVPGVFAQPKWGDDTRLSIRGSGLSRNFHLRGVQLFMDGVPINTADGYGDFQEIDPTAYRYVEAFRGANALRFGANALGGAINFVTPSGRDASLAQGRLDFGSFGFRRIQGSSGASSGAWDYFVTGSASEQDGFREHSWGNAVRGSANVGYRFTPDVETRFYINANSINQRIPGSVTRASALTSPKTAAVGNVVNDQQRNIDTVRFANKTTIRFDDSTLEVGAFAVDRHLMHPIFQWLDYKYQDAGGFARLVDRRTLGGRENRLVAGVNLHGGVIDNEQYANVGGRKGALMSKSTDRSFNASAYLENTFFALPTVGLVAGTQYLYATRRRTDLFPGDGDQSGSKDFSIFSPKLGLLWEVRPDWQVFANLSRSAEVPSFGENSFASAAASSIKAQRATTIEIGTRGRRDDYSWDLAAYRAQIDNELQCLFSSFGNCTVVNADKTVHQGLEVGFGAAVLNSLLVAGPAPDKVWVNLAYTFNDFRFDGDARFGDNRLPGAPAHMLRGEILYRHPAGFYFGPNVEWVPQAYFVDSANTLKTAAYAVWGLKAGYDTGTGFSAYVEGRNLSDRKYIASASIIDVATAGSPLFEPGSGRAVYGGVQYRW